MISWQKCENKSL